MGLIHFLVLLKWIIMFNLLFAFSTIANPQTNEFESGGTFFEPPIGDALDSSLGGLGSSSAGNDALHHSADQPPKIFNIGAVLSKEEYLQDFLQVIDSIYYEPNVLPPGLTLYPHSLPMNPNPIKTVQNVCDKLIKSQVYVVLVSDDASAESLAVTQTCGLYQIPVIGLSNRDSSMSDKHMHPVYMRTVPPFAHQVDVWVRLLQQLEYRHVVYIHTGDYDGRSSSTRFQHLADKADIEISQVIEYRPGAGRLSEQLAHADSHQSRVYLLYGNQAAAQAVFLEAERLRLTGAGYVWLVAEQALETPNIPDGAIGVRLFAANNASAHIRDALFVVGMALREWTSSVANGGRAMHYRPPDGIHTSGIDNVGDLELETIASGFTGPNLTNFLYTPPPSYCGDHKKSAWLAGQRFYNVLRKQSLLYGRSGRVAFDGKGDRISADYDIVNIVRNRPTIIGSYAYNQAKRRMQLWLNEISVVWPGGITERPAGYVLPEQIRVVTLQEKPFVWTRPVHDWQVQNLRLHVRRVNHEFLVSSGLRDHGLMGKQPLVTSHIDAEGNVYPSQVDTRPTGSTLYNRPTPSSSKSRSRTQSGRSSSRSKLLGNSASTPFPFLTSTTDHGMLPGYDSQGRIRSRGSGTAIPITTRRPSTFSGGKNTPQPPPVDEDESLDLPNDMLPGMLRFDSSFLQKELCERNELLCPKTDKNGKLRYYCCKGYCIDLLVELANRLNISFNLHQVQDGQYGSFEPDSTVGGRRSWNGLVGEIVSQQSDMIVAPLTINPERSLYIDFSKPFKYQGITIIERQQTASRASLASFMEPFEDSLWILVMVSVHVVALALYLLDRFSPFGRYRLPNCDVTEEDALNLSSATWFAWGVLLNSGIGEGTPRSFSGRVLGMVWAGFAMIIVASYTGNLAAFLVLNRPENTLTGINDSRLRNPTDNYTYSTVKNSAVEMYFKRQMELVNIYSHLIKNRPHYTVEEGIEAVKNNEINAFIWDSARLEYEASQDCGLVIAAEQFGRSGYGIGLVKNSFWTEKVNQAILSMHESGFMEKLDNEWILNVNPECTNRNIKFPTTLGLRNMAGVFILVGIGIVGGIGLIVIEVIYKKQQVRKQRQLENARYAAEKWKKFVKRRRNYRTNAQQMRHIRMRHKMEQQHSQPSQDSTQPLLTASPINVPLSGHTNPHLSLSKCNSGATDVQETPVQSLAITRSLLVQTGACSEESQPVSNEPQLQLRNRKSNLRTETQKQQLPNEIPLQMHDVASFEQPMQTLYAPPSQYLSHNLSPSVPDETDVWQQQQQQHSSAKSLHQRFQQASPHSAERSGLGTTLHSLPPHVLARSAAITPDSCKKRSPMMNAAGSQKSQFKSNSLHQLQHQAPLSIYQADLSTSGSGFGSSAGHPQPPKPNRKAFRTQPQLHHQQAIITSNESLMQPYISPAHHHTSVHSIYQDQLCNPYGPAPMNHSVGNLYATTSRSVPSNGGLRTGSVIRPPHSGGVQSQTNCNLYYDYGFNG